VAAVAEILTHFQGTGEFRADFDPQVMAMAVRAAIDTVGPRLVRDPGLDVAHHARELASLFVPPAARRASRRRRTRNRRNHESVLGLQIGRWGRNQELLVLTQAMYNAEIKNHVWGEHATEFLATGTAVRRLADEHTLPETTPKPTFTLSLDK
jgi:hypothetical protein